MFDYLYARMTWSFYDGNTKMNLVVRCGGDISI